MVAQRWAIVRFVSTPPGDPFRRHIAAFFASCQRNLHVPKAVPSGVTVGVSLSHEYRQNIRPETTVPKSLPGHPE